MIASIVKNSSYLIFGQVTTKVIGFIYSILLARFLGVSDFGLYIIAITYFSFFSSITDLGFNRYILREVVKDNIGIKELVSSVFLIRLILGILIVSFFYLFLLMTESNIAKVWLFVLAIFTILPQSLASTFDGILLASKKVVLSTIGLVFLGISNIFIGLIFLGLNFAVLGAILAFLLSYTLYFLITYYLSGGIKFKFYRTIRDYKKLLIGVLPYGILGILSILYFRIDILLLSHFRGVEEISLYGLSFRFLEAISFFPVAISSVLFPSFASLHIKGSIDVIKLYWASFKILGFISIFIFLGYLLLTPIFVRSFLPEYIGAITSIIILSFSIPFMFLHLPATNLLLSSEKFLKPVIHLSLLTALFNIVLNIIFIPKYGFIASAWITVGSEILSFLLFFIYLKRVVLDK